MQKNINDSFSTKAESNNCYTSPKNIKSKSSFDLRADRMNFLKNSRNVGAFSPQKAPPITLMSPQRQSHITLKDRTSAKKLTQTTKSSDFMINLMCCETKVTFKEDLVEEIQVPCWKRLNFLICQRYPSEDNKCACMIL